MLESRTFSVKGGLRQNDEAQSYREITPELEATELEKLDLGDPFYSLELLRAAVRAGSVGTTAQSARYNRMREKLVNANLDHRKNSLPQCHKSGLQKLAAVAFRYTQKSSQTQMEDGFLSAVGELYLSDLIALEKQSVYKPEIMALWLSAEKYAQQIQHLCEQYDIEPWVAHVAYKLNRLQPEIEIQNYQSRLGHCTTVLVPALASRYGYEGIVPYAVLEKICIDSPLAYEEKLARWFDDSWQVHQAYGGDAFKLINKTGMQNNIAPLLLEKANAASLIDVENIQLTPETKLAAAELRSVNRQQVLRISPSVYKSWDTMLLQQTIARHPGYQDMDVKNAAGYVAHGVKIYNEFHKDKSLPTDLRFLVSVALEYLDNVRELQDKVYRPYSVARYHTAGIVLQLREAYKNNSGLVNRSVIKVALKHKPSRPNEWIDTFLDTVKEVQDYIEQQTGLQPEESIASTIARQSLAGALSQADKFLERYYELREMYRYDDDLEKWMLFKVAAFWPSNMRRGVQYYKYLTKKGVFQEKPDVLLRNRGGSIIKKELIDPAGDPLDQLVRQESVAITQQLIKNYMSSLELQERLAVAVVFGLEIGDYLPEDEVRAQLGVDDLPTYVMNVLVPRLRLANSLNDLQWYSREMV